MGEKNENRNFKNAEGNTRFSVGPAAVRGPGGFQNSCMESDTPAGGGGYAIEAVRNRGYRLVASPDVITAPELKTVLSTVWLGSQVNCFYETDSTNRQARKLAEEGAPHGTLVAADSQSAGKGRRGRAWASPRGVGVWMSFILRPELSPSKASS